MKNMSFRPLLLCALFAAAASAASAATGPNDVAALRANAEKGNPVAQYILGLVCADPTEAAHDPAEAYVWLSLATSSGAASQQLDSLRSSLTPAQLAAAQQRLADHGFTPVPSAVQLAQDRLRLTADLTAAQQDNAQLKASLDAAGQAAAERDRLRAELADLRKNTPAAPAADVATLQAERDQLARNTQALEKERDDLKVQLATAELREKLASGKAAPPAATPSPAPGPDAPGTTQLKEQLAATETSLATARQELDSLRQRSLGGPSPEAFAALKAERDQLAAERDALKAQTAPAAAPAAAGTDDLKQKLDLSDEKLAAALRAYTVQLAELDRLQKSLVSVDAERAAAAARADALASQLADAGKSTGERDVRVAQLEQDLAAVRSTSAATDGTLATLREQLRQTQDMAAAVGAENQSFRTRLALAGAPPAVAFVAPERPAPAVPAEPAPLALPPAETPAATPAETPAPPAAEARIHVVAAGDSLTKIARRYYGSANRWNDILAANKGAIKNPNLLIPGTKLTIP